jgi:hypothetical protein
MWTRPSQDISDYGMLIPWLHAYSIQRSIENKERYPGQQQAGCQLAYFERPARVTTAL